jgi:multidrug efflux pump subunit AcrA (membrane-fusion protein)
MTMRMLPFFLLAVCAAAVNAEATPDRWRPSEHQSILSRTIPGYTRPRRTLELASEFGGRLSSFRASEGEHLFVPVAKGGKSEVGDFLVALDDTFEQLAVDAAKSRLDAANAGYQIAVAAKKEAEIAKRYADEDWERIKKLAGGLIREDERDSARHKNEVAPLAISKAEQQVNQAKSQVKQADADHANALERLGRCKLRVPATEESEIARLAALFPSLDVEKDRLIDWVVEQRNVEAGTQVRPGQGILRLADVGLLKIELRLADEELAAVDALMQRDKNVPITFSASGKKAESVVARRDHEYDPNSRKRMVELWVPGSIAPEATGGLAVELTLSLRAADNAVMVPDKFISLPRNERTYVKLADGRELEVRVLRRQGDRVFITSDGIPADAEFIAYPK